MRRPVRTRSSFWSHLDHALPAERGPHGQPSRHDFASTDLMEIIERFAQQWDTLPPLIPGRTDYRELIGSGRLGLAFAVQAQLASDGAVELVGISIEPIHTDDIPEDD